MPTVKRAPLERPQQEIKENALTETHLNRVASFYDEAPFRINWARRFFGNLLARYYRLIIPMNASILEIGCGSGELLAHFPNADLTGIDISPRQLERAKSRLPHATFHCMAGENMTFDRTFDYIIISETINLAADVQLIFERANYFSHPGTRMVINFYNMLWRPFFTLATRFGIRQKTPVENWLSLPDVHNLLSLADWQMVKTQWRILLPLPVPFFEPIFNRWIAPLLSWLCLTVFCTSRPLRIERDRKYTVSVIVPARNEAGNIENIIQRTPEIGAGTEIIFVEGNSTDNTWQTIQEVVGRYKHRNIKILQQTGSGKGNAVREGFAVATGDIFMILDADITVPPEELPKFYDVIASRHGEFANGVRLVYPMEAEAMRFLNLCANRFFSIAFSWLLMQPVKDTLCGTKAMFQEDYEKIVENRAYFGDFDPFGDFDLLFGADKLNLKITDIPIRYRDRTYGETNIKRWSHGALLIRMVLFAARKLRFT